MHFKSNFDDYKDENFDFVFDDSFLLKDLNEDDKNTLINAVDILKNNNKIKSNLNNKVKQENLNYLNIKKFVSLPLIFFMKCLILNFTATNELKCFCEGFQNKESYLKFKKKLSSIFIIYIHVLWLEMILNLKIIK
jgi:hypothetical protein